MTAIGSPAWASATGGALGARDRLRFVAGAAGQEVAEVLGRLRGRRDGLVGVASRLPNPPESALTRRLAALTATVLAPALLAHSHRTWAWGALLAEIDNVDHDPELLYAAALLHDIGLSESHVPPAGAGCFAVHGAGEARQILLAHGAGQEFAEDAAAAIVAHFNARVPLSWGAEAHLLHAGAHLDVVGRRLGDLSGSSVDQVLANWPRDDFADWFAAAMAKEALLRPRSRAGVLWGLGMRGAIERAKFPTPGVLP